MIWRRRGATHCHAYISEKCYSKSCLHYLAGKQKVLWFVKINRISLWRLFPRHQAAVLLFWGCSPPPIPKVLITCLANIRWKIWSGWILLEYSLFLLIIPTYKMSNSFRIRVKITQHLQKPDVFTTSIPATRYIHRFKNCFDHKHLLPTSWQTTESNSIQLLEKVIHQNSPTWNPYLFLWNLFESRPSHHLQGSKHHLGPGEMWKSRGQTDGFHTPEVAFPPQRICGSLALAHCCHPATGTMWNVVML